MHMKGSELSPMSSLVFATTAVTSLNMVFFKRMLNCYRSSQGGADGHDYAVFVSVFDILLWALVMTAVSGVKGFSSSFPRRGVLRVAMLDQLGTLLATLGATYVPGQAQVLLNQTVLPLTMVMSAALGQNYSTNQVLGAAVVLAGAWMATKSLPLGVSPRGGLMRASVAAFFMAQVTCAAAGLVKESLLRQIQALRLMSLGSIGASGTKEGDDRRVLLADPLALGVAVAWVRVPFGIALALLMRRSQGTLWTELHDGWWCFCGYSPRPGDLGCSEAGHITLISVALYAGQTILGLRLTQRGSATLRSLAGVTAVPLSQLFFTSELLMGEGGAEAYSCWVLGGLVLCTAGTMTFNCGRHASTVLSRPAVYIARLSKGCEQHA